MIAMILVSACTSGSITTTDLPDGQVGVRYSVAIEGDRSRKARYSATGLPEGLTINPSSGIVSGVPQENSEGTVTVRLDTAKGRTLATQDLALTVERSEGPCGQRFEGTFTELGRSVDGDLDWSAEGGWAVIRLPVPGDAVEELTLELQSDFVFPYFVSPGQPLVPDTSLEGQSTLLFDNTGLYRIGWNTTPNLGAYQAVGGELVVVLVSLLSQKQSWSLQSSCTRAPVLTSNGLGPYRVGDRVRSGFGATKLDEDVTVEALDPLPEGLELSQRGGLNGEARHSGLHRFRIRLTRQTTGVVTDEEVAVGMYEPLEPICGETLVLPSRGDQVEGFPDSINPDAFVALEAPWEDRVGLRYDVDVQGTSTVQMLPIEPDTPIFNWTFGTPFLAVAEATPQSWPPASHYQRDPSFRMVIGSASPFGGEVTLTCDEGPRPAERLPTVLPAVPVDAALQAVGGVPPYTWVATALPDGLSLSADGVLTGVAAEGPVVVGDLLIEDAEGRSTTTEITWWTESAACDRMVPCDTPWEISVDAGQPEAVCVPSEDVMASDWIGYVVDFDGIVTRSLLPPGAFDSEYVSESYRGFRGALVADRGNNRPSFALDRYDQRPWPQLLESSSGTATISGCTVCGVGPTPPSREVTCE